MQFLIITSDIRETYRSGKTSDLYQAEINIIKVNVGPMGVIDIQCSTDYYVEGCRITQQLWTNRQCHGTRRGVLLC